MRRGLGLRVQVRSLRRRGRQSSGSRPGLLDMGFLGHYVGMYGLVLKRERSQ